MQNIQRKKKSQYINDSTQLDPTSHKTIKRGSTQPINHPTSNLKHTQIKNISKTHNKDHRVT